MFNIKNIIQNLKNINLIGIEYIEVVNLVKKNIKI